MSATVGERHFRAMGSDVHVIVVGVDHGTNVDALIELAVARIAQLESRWSRFLPDSEVSELNRRAGEALAVSADTVLLVNRAIEAWRLTGGSFDPTVLGAMLTAGYDRSFDELATADRPAPAPSSLVVGCTDIAVDGGAVRLPAGTGFDPGGIGKGLAADLVVHDLTAGGAAGACVNLGGDLRVTGVGPDGGAWTVAIEHPWQGDAVALVGLADGAVATSTTLKRTWTNDGVVRHHLIDPATGEPSDTDLNLVSVIAGQAWMAEVLAKAVLLRGAARAFDLLDPSIANALTVDGTGTVRSTPGLAAHLGGVALPARLTATVSPAVATSVAASFAPSVPTPGHPIPQENLS